MPALTVGNLLKKKYALMKFTGAWRNTFGTPAPNGVWTIQGRSGSGKTTFALQLVKYLRRQQKRVIYWSLEQCGDYGFQLAVRRANLSKGGGVVFFGNEADAETEILSLMERPRGYDVLIIDSLTALHNNRPSGFCPRDFVMWQKRLADKLVIYICHEKNGTDQLETPAGNYIKQQANIKVTVVGFVAYANARAGFLDGGGEPYVIDQALADEYHLQNV